MARPAMMRPAVALAAAIALLVAIPILVVRAPAPAPAIFAEPQAAPPRLSPAGTIDALLVRDPFAAPSPADDAEPAADDADGPPAIDDAAPPRIAGIVGRLPDHAVVLVRRAGGGTRTLSIGESVGRWRLVSIVADAALFADGGRSVRVDLPAGR